MVRSTARSAARPHRPRPPLVRKRHPSLRRSADDAAGGPCRDRRPRPGRRDAADRRRGGVAARDDGLRSQATEGEAVSDGGATLRAEILAAASGHILARAIHVAVSLKLADRFGDEPRTASQLAGELGVDERALRRLLHFLARHLLFEESPEGSFRLTARGAMLRSDAPAATADVIRSLGHPRVWNAFGQLEQVVRS